MRAALDRPSQVALIEIMDMLGLQRIKLTRSEEHGLLDRFYSMPAALRDDADAIEAVLNPVLRSLTGLDRAETRATVRQSDGLQKLLHTITNKIGDLSGDRRLQKLPQSAAE